MSKRSCIVYGVCILLLIIAAGFDYSIDAFLYDPNNLYAIIFERYVLGILACMLPFSMMSFYRVMQKKGYLCLAVIASMYAASQMLADIPEVKGNTIFFAILTVALIVGFYIITHMIDVRTLKQYAKFLFIICFVFIVSQIFIHIIKEFWGRVRFRQLQDISQFTPWYLPQGRNGYRSFPSGHTAMMSGVVCLTLLPKRIPRFKYRMRFLSVITFGLVIAMGLARMIIGAHYLSDVTVGFMIVYTVIRFADRAFW